MRVGVWVGLLLAPVLRCGSVTVEVADKQGFAITDAEVRLVPLAGGVEIEAAARRSGALYTFDDVESGTYFLKIAGPRGSQAENPDRDGPVVIILGSLDAPTRIKPKKCKDVCEADTGYVPVRLVETGRRVE